MHISRGCIIIEIITPRFQLHIIFPIPSGTSDSLSSTIPNSHSLPHFPLSISILNMGISHSTVRWAARLSLSSISLLSNMACCLSPNLKDIHDVNISFWSPQPYFIAAFFFSQQIFQLVWLYRLYKLDPKKSEKEKNEVNTMLVISALLSLISTLGIELKSKG